jgi:iron complex outermembrane receptor protein
MNKKTVLKSAVLVVAVQMAWASSAHAQTQPPPSSGKAAEPEASPQTIESIVVQGQFLGSGAASAMKIDIPVRDTPFAVNSYTESFMKAIETTNIGDMYNYMNGVKRAGNTAYDLTIRGFKTGGDDKNAIMVDGLPGLTGRFGSPPTVGVDHIELVKGPMSVLYGQIQPGGFVNIISKKPRGTPSYAFDLKGQTYASSDKPRFGDRNGYTLSADATGPIDADRRFLYRVVAEYSDRDLFRDFTYEKGSYVAPSVTWNITDSTFLTALVEHRTVENAYDDGLAAPGLDISRVAPRTTYYHEPGDVRKETGDAVSLQGSHSFNDNLTWNAALRSVINSSDDQAFASVAVRPNGTSLQRRARLLHAKNEYHYLDTNINAQFATGFLKHKAMVGINVGQDKVHQWRERFFNSGACPGPTCIDIAVYNPVYGRVPAMTDLPAFNNDSLKSDRHFKSESRGIYASDLVTITEQWKAVFGVRNVHEKQTIAEVARPTPVAEKTADKGAVPMGGLLFQPDKMWTIYGSYAESYVPADASLQDINGQNPFLPIVGKQYEVGTKAEGLLGGRLNGTFALFTIDRDNTLNSFACPRGTCQQQLGGERSRGAELEFNARPLENWQIVFGYAFVDATVRSSRTLAQVGARLPNVARNSANLWSRYDIKSGLLQGLGIGVGVVYTGERVGLLPTSTEPRTLRLPSYAVMDLGFYYVFDRYAVNLKIGNVFDKNYIESAGSLAQVRLLPGAPRNVALSLRTHF